MKDSKSGKYEYVVYIVKAKYNTEVKRYSYLVKNQDNIEYKFEVADNQLKLA